MQVPKSPFLNDDNEWMNIASLSPNSFYEFFDVRAYKNS